ncbi:tRNA pseudouridine65 synthase/23S rRNA pseudouridine1911/1915/1917 synthase [Lishizhenia tianjinensis]|uniref:tRNA pseudouridine65 synthase/23S rRNA pseudouridine1911/1915/1917 synthase n=1 Tax=Lishizhenia tianjinensis TaxID=477690 RepID=A0A1I6YKG0_9FLAO|nr:RluA family pseudouridine synthase [Lishizhenia tianjinensis]SFT50838.1 tRNA pseudouridine65 synthase/23S rRNA pseudouridine1911/1915/1917 synthase [Lishizhenia tianjinensis]
MEIIIGTHTVTEELENIRVSDYLALKFPQLQSRKAVKKALKKKLLLHNKNIALSGTYVKQGDLFELLEEQVTPPKIFPLGLEVLFEDEYLAVVFKPAGFPVSGNQYKTIHNALPHNLSSSQETDALNWPLPVHRLDAPTSGLLIIAKTHGARIALGEMLAKKEIQKHYHAVVQGYFNTKGILNTPIEGKKAESHLKTLSISPSKLNGHLSLLELSPLTGRTHQLRIHLSRLGHPIAGDKIYGKPGNTIGHKGLFLSAIALEFIHPKTNEKIEIRVKHPAKFDSYLAREARNATLE